MTKKPELKPQQTLPVVQDAQLDADIMALATEARSLTDDVRVGDDLKFRKGKWVKIIDDDESKVGATASFVVDVRSYKRGWIKWLDRKPVFKAIRRPIDGFVSPPRNRLPDQDKAEWPRDAKGVPQDPWQENFSIVMRDRGDKRLCTWVTTGWYGPKALGALLDSFVRDQKKHPGLMPVVTLSSEIRVSTSYGEIDAPLLTVVDWQSFGEGASPPGMKLPAPALPTVQQEVLPPIGKDMSDEIPF